MGRPINATQSDSDLESAALGKLWFFSFGESILATLWVVAQPQACESILATLWVVAQPQASAVKMPAALLSTL